MRTVGPGGTVTDAPAETLVSAIAINVNAPLQLQKLLFDELGLASGRRTTTGKVSTDSTVLENLRDAHEVVPLVLEYRQLTKLKSTYIDALPGLVDPTDGRVHTSFNQTVAATGRLSSSDPNLQNIPIRTELGRRIRRAFIARPGNVLVSADYSQIELRVLAHLSQDPALVERFNRVFGAISVPRRAGTWECSHVTRRSCGLAT